MNIIETSIEIPSLNQLLKSDILKEEWFGDFSSKNKLDWLRDVNFYGPLLKSQLIEQDFQELTFSKFIEEVENYWKEDDWGDDLPIFKKNFHAAIKLLKNYDLENRLFYYLNMEDLEQGKLEEYNNGYYYFICAISILKRSNKVNSNDFWFRLKP